MNANEAVVDKFVGKYKSKGKGTCSDPNKLSWFPKENVALEVSKVLMKDRNGNVVDAFAQIKIDECDAKFAIENTVYRVVGDNLVGNMQLEPGLIIEEILSMKRQDGKKEMTHNLKFSDGHVGAWICPD